MWPCGKIPWAPIPWALSTSETKDGWFPELFGQEYGLNVVLVLLLTVGMFLYLKYSKQGYEISVVGDSENTARYAGINVKKVTIRTMAISGAICGLAGFIAVAGASHTISTSTAGGRGFTAIIVAWLAQFNTFVMILISFLLVFLQKGAIQIASQFNLNDYASNIITGIILFFILGSEFFINYRIILRSGKEGAEMSVDQICSSCFSPPSQFGTVILFGAMGEILTEKSGNLNLGVPGHHVSGRHRGTGGLLLL